jgi:pyruvate dehydrogenase E1 component alpha subunit
VLWVCENNQYGMGTSVERASAVSEIRQKAEGYGMPNYRIEGMNVIEVREKALQLFEEIREGSGPQFLEVITYRYRGHSMGDPERYRQAEEIKRWQAHDPIGIYRKYLMDNGICTEEELDKQDELAEQEVNEAVEFAQSSPEPEPEELYTDVYVVEEEW